MPADCLFDIFLSRGNIVVTIVNQFLLYLRIKVQPKSKESAIGDLMEDGTLKVRVKAAPEKGKANKEVIKLLAKKYGVKKSGIEIVSGKTEPIKLIKIEK